MKREVLLEYLRSGAVREQLEPVYGGEAAAAETRLLELTESLTGIRWGQARPGQDGAGSCGARPGTGVGPTGRETAENGRYVPCAPAPVLSERFRKEKQD